MNETVTAMTDAERAEHLRKLIAGDYPDEHGRYGPYGGAYAPEFRFDGVEAL